MNDADRDEMIVELLTRILSRLDAVEEEIGGKPDDDEAAHKLADTLGSVLERSATDTMARTAQESEKRTIETIDREIRLANALHMGRRHRWSRVDWSVLGLTGVSALLLGSVVTGWLFVASEGATLADRLALPGIASPICSAAGGELGDLTSGGEACLFVISR